MSDSDLEFRIAKLDVKPGDILVVKLDCRASNEMTAHAQAFFRRNVPPEINIIVIDRGVDLSVLSASEIASRVV